MDHRPAVSLGLLLLLLSCPGGSEPRRQTRDVAPPRGRASQLRFLPAAGQSVVGRFLSTLHLARGGRASGQVGDYFARSTSLLAVIRAADGSLTDLASGPDFTDRLGWGHVAVCDGGGRHGVQVAAVDIVTGLRPAIVVRGQVRRQRDWLEVQTEYHVPPGRRHVVLTTTVSNPLRQHVWRNLAVCDNLGLGNTRLFVPKVGHVLKPGTYQARFCGLEEHGLSTVLMVPRGAPPMRLRLELSKPVPAFDPSADAEYGRVDLAPGKRLVVRRVLAVGRGGLHEALAEALSGYAVRGAGGPRTSAERSAQDVTVRRVAVSLPGAGRLMVSREGAPYLWSSVTGKPGTQVRLTVEPGPLMVSLWQPGAGAGAAIPLVDGISPGVPISSELRLRVEVDGSTTPPVKLVFHGQRGTPDPDFGNDGTLQADNVVYAAGGELSVHLAPGHYRVTATRGFDYTVATGAVVLRAPRPVPARSALHSREAPVLPAQATLRLSLKRVVPAAGWAALDPHLHSYASFDCPIAPADRVISVGALGLDLMVFTDHNAVTGYSSPGGPSSRGPSGGKPRSGAERSAQDVTEPGLPLVVAGQEVTTTGNLFGHFNVFPLDPRRPPLRAWDTSPTQLFREAGKRGKPVLIQVNHPRMGSIGYFDQMELDARTDKARSAGYDPGFQLLELFNGDHIDHLDQVQRVMQDWFALLNAGRRYVATGGSDAHRLPYQDPGYPRTYVLWAGATPDSKTAPKTQPDAETILKALAAGRAVVSTGPRVELTVDGQPVGSQVKLGPRGSALRIRVQAAPWVDVRRVELWENGKQVQSLAVAPRRTVERLNHTQRIQPRHDSWYVVIVRGERPDPTQTRRVIPFAVTNPVWVDADRDGTFRSTSPGP